jgi:cysteine desulfurase
MGRFYFDHAASTPVAPEVFGAMKPYFTDPEKSGNPGSLHSFGQEAMAAVDRSREIIAKVIDAKFREVVFTGSATEANNLALRGAVVRARPDAELQTPRVIVSAVEHESVLETARSLRQYGVEVVEIPVDREGIVKTDALSAALSNSTVIVSVMYANNETGAVQPIAKIAKIIREFREAAGPASSPTSHYPLFHVDAAQAFQFLDCRPAELGADLMTLSAHKIYGPKGVGALYVGKQAGAPAPVLFGGGQEFGLRSGTENVPLIVGFAAAVEYIEKDKEKHAKRIAALKEQFVQGIKKIYPKAKINGPNSPKDGLPHIANVWLPGRKAGDMLIRLDLAGIAVSAGSACAARSSQPSHVLSAMGFNDSRARESLRVSFGRSNTPMEVKKLLANLVKFRS